MRQPQPAELLRIHISEADRHQGRPLYEAIVDKCRELRIAGATVFLGLEGYGESTELHRAGLLHHNCPVVINIVDTPENIQRLIAAAAEMIDTGLMARSPVEMIRVEKSPPA